MPAFESSWAVTPLLRRARAMVRARSVLGGMWRNVDIYVLLSTVSHATILGWQTPESMVGSEGEEPVDTEEIPNYYKYSRARLSALEEP